MARHRDPFKVYIRREEGYGLTIAARFEVNDGMGVLAIQRPGRREAEPCPIFEESEIDAGALRAGRFIHILSDGRRQSYALSRMVVDKLHRLPAASWTELEPDTEFGFRYLNLPDDLGAVEAPASAAVSVAAAPAAAVAAPAAPVAAAAVSVRPAASVSVGPAVAVAKPAPVVQQKASVAQVVSPSPKPAPTPATPVRARSAAPRAARLPGSRSAGVASGGMRRVSSGRPARQTAVEPTLADSAINGLTKAAAVEHLRVQMAKVAELHALLDDAERRLAQSAQREQDLLEVLGRWQQMEGA